MLDIGFVAVIVIIALIFGAGIWCGMEIKKEQYGEPKKIKNLRY